MLKLNVESSAHFHTPLKPLVVAIKALLAGAILSFSVTPLKADSSHLPVPETVSTLPDHSHPTGTPTTLTDGQTDNLNASYGSATGELSGNTLYVKPSDNAIIEWKSFNIDKGYTVDFEQNSSSSVVLNNIGDANASQIMGHLIANGEVFLVNQNGFVFGPNSEVNVNSLVASSLGISQADLINGISNVFNNAYNSNGSEAAALNGSGKYFLQDSQGNFILDQTGHKIPISIEVQGGAKIQSNATGGLILLAAPTVKNAGTISAKQGQVILAASTDKVYLQDSKDSNIRGMLVEVGTGGQVTNTGSVLAQTGNVSMIGFAVNQQGIASASTSVSLNGSVRLLAEEGIQNPNSTSNHQLLGASTVRTASQVAQIASQEGLSSATDIANTIPQLAVVNLENNSKTSVDLDTTNQTTALAAQSQPQSFIEISANRVNLFDGSTVLAHSGKVTIDALDTPVSSTTSTLDNASTKSSTAHIYMQSGSSIDVSGLQNVAESVADNYVSLKLQSNELRDSPQQRNGVLYGQTVSMDVRDATLAYNSAGILSSAKVPIADIIGPVQSIKSTLAERNVAGGTINLNSSGDTIINSGANLNISGGWIAYQTDNVYLTQILSGGQWYNISTASPNLTYTQVHTSKVLEQGYDQGAAGGHLTINSYAAILDGNLQAHTKNGSQQRESGDWAKGTSLAINLYNDALDVNKPAQNVIFDNTNSGSALSATDSIPLQANTNNDVIPLTLDVNVLNQSGLQNLNIATNGTLKLTDANQLTLADKGSLSFTALNMDLEGSLLIPDGTVNLRSGGISDLGVVPTGNNISHNIVLGSNAIINVSGLWINDYLDNQIGHTLSQVAIDAGSVTINAVNGQIDLQKGSQINANAGAWNKSNANVQYGKAGSISLDASSVGASLNMQGAVAAWGAQNNGSLTLKANQVVIGDASAVSSANGAGQALILTQDFFKPGGFSSYDITSSINSLEVTKDTQIILEQTNNIALTNQAETTATGTYLTAVNPSPLPQGARHAVDLTLTFSGENTATNTQELILDSGSLIQTSDPGGSITLNSSTSIIVSDGVKIDSPAGQIKLSLYNPGGVDPGYINTQGIWLGANSELDAKGIFVPQYSSLGLNTGSVLAGGSVSLSASRGYIVTEADSKIDVSGSSAVLQSIETSGQGTQTYSTFTPSAGGSIKFTAGEGILADGSLAAQSGGANAAGGTLAVSLDSSLIQSNFPVLPSIIKISASDTNSAPAGLGSAIDDTHKNQVDLKSSDINAAGFSRINLQTDALLSGNTLKSGILFDGDVTLTAQQQIILDTPSLQSNTDSAHVYLNAPYVALGSTLVNQQNQGYLLAGNATTGSADLNVGSATYKVQGVDLMGGISFNGFDQVNLNSQTDLRMIGDINAIKHTDLGELNLAGDLNISAQRVYPTTLTNYTLNVSGTATFKYAATPTTATELFSAGAALTVNAGQIIQDGQLDVPFGSLILNATDQVTDGSATLTLGAGSVTSVSGKGSIVPFGIVSGGSIWLYPLDNSGLNNDVVYSQTVSNLPQKSLTLEGQNIDMQAATTVNGVALKAATIDLSGGGDLYAYDFITGIGGSKDVLDVPVSQAFAVIPGINGIQTPYDPQQYTTSGLSMGESVYLHAANGLPAGWYTILPAHYALLPGAYLITPESGTAGQTQTSYTADGNTIVSGYYGVAGTAIQNAVSQGFEVQAGSFLTGSVNANGTINTDSISPSQFSAELASSEIAKLAAKNAVLPQLPQDGGSLLIAATHSLTLDANLQAAPLGSGRGGQVDISADNLVVVGNQNDLSGLPSGTVGLVASQLNNFNAPSLLLGGKRSITSSGELVTVTALNVTLAGDAVLKGQEILLAASNQVTVAANAQLQGDVANSSSNSNTESLRLENANGTSSDGAFLRVSSVDQATIARDLPLSGGGGILDVESGALLQAASSNYMLLDSTQNTVFQGQIQMTNGGLAMDASQISIGQVTGNPSGLILNNIPSQLNTLSLNSQSNIDLYGAVNLNAQNINLSAAAINGFNTVTGQTATITASNQLSIANTAATANDTGTGQGTLSLNAQNVQLGSGNYAITGFQNVNITATQDINGQGASQNATTQDKTTAVDGNLTVAANLNMTADTFSGGSGATTKIDATGHTIELDYQKTPANITSASPSTGLGVSWAFNADSINSGAHFALPSGSLQMTAQTGNLELTNTSQIDLSAREVLFNNSYQYSTGGNLSLTALNSNVNLDSGAQIKLAGFEATQKNGNLAELSNAGSLNVQAINGSFNWDGSIDAGSGAALASGVSGANLSLNVKSFGQSDFSSLNTEIANAGFNNQLMLEQQTGNVDITANTNLIATALQLNVDQGAVTIAGTINTSGSSAGKVSIYAANGITLASTGKINAYATAANQSGGTVTLDTVNRNGNDAGSGLLDLSATGGQINISAGSGGLGGVLHLRTGRDDTADTINVTNINSQINGSSNVWLEATRVYANINAGTSDANSITADNINQWQQDTAAFMQNAPQIVNNSNASISLLPGIEVRSNGDLNLNSSWDFMSGGSGWNAATSSWNSGWRYGNEDVPGFLTLRAAADLNINSAISDGLAASPLPGLSKVYQNVIQSGLSWNYALVAGNNVNLAASYTDPNTGNDTQVVVRTGTGAIDIQAGKDIVFNQDNFGALNSSNDASAVYTVGSVASYTTADLLAGNVPGLPAQQSGETLASYLSSLSQSQLNQVLRYGLLPEAGIGNTTYPLTEYPTQGGDISLTAGGDITGQQTGQQIAAWLVASGSGGKSSYTSWGLNLSGGDSGSNTNNHNFNENVGALGDGNVTVNAGGNINNLSVMIPTTGKPLGVVDSYAARNAINWQQSSTYINGGGNLQVTAGKNIIGGEYYDAGLNDGNGGSSPSTANVEAGGAIQLAPISNSSDSIGLILDVGNAVFNVQSRQDIEFETAMSPNTLLYNSTQSGTVFYGYATDSAVNLKSTAGNIVFLNNVNALQALKNFSFNVSSGNPSYAVTVYPGILSALALSGDIRLDNSMNLFPSIDGSLQLLANGNIDMDAAAIAAAEASGLSNSNGNLITMSNISPDQLPNIKNPAVSLNSNQNFASYINSANGAGLLSNAQIPLGDQQTSLFIANQGSIVFPGSISTGIAVPTAATVIAKGNISNFTIVAQNQTSSDISLVQAGGDLNYDTSYDSNGLVPQASSAGGISVAGPGELLVLAGGDINLGSSQGIISIANQDNIALPSSGASVSVLAGLGNATQIDAANYLTSLNNLFSEIRLSVIAAATVPESQRFAKYQLGKDAIKALFPSACTAPCVNQYKGDINMVFSQIASKLGGDVNILTPGGAVNVGYAGTQTGNNKTTDELGILVEGTGDLNILTYNDISVNQSRVFTEGGGNITGWSIDANIDAGKGARSALSVSPPIVQIGPSGQISVTIPPVIAGSGIQAVGGGNIYLAAPVGVINAGEAGISGNQDFLAGVVQNGGNVTAGPGGVVGLPTVSAPVSLAGADSAAAGASKSGSQSNADERGANNSADNKQKNNVVILNTDVIGFGKCSVGDIKAASSGCGS